MKNTKKLTLFLALVLIILSVAGCTAENEIVEDDETTETESYYPIEIEDEFGNKEIIEKEPMKIVSLAPSNTEMLFALGLGDKVVGVTSFCDYPEEAKSKEKIGSYSDYNLEKIVELGPDLVLSYGLGDEENNKILRDAGIKVLGFMSETVDGVVSDIQTLGKTTGTEDKANELTTEMIDKKNHIVEKVKDQEKKRVFYEIWHDPLQAAGKGSFMGEIIELAGGQNIADDAETPYPQYDLEQLIERDPEVYLTAADMPEKDIDSIKNRPGFSGITAIKNDNIHIFEGDDSNVVSRSGPRIVEALELVAKAIYPEIFE